jgi:hypothetical protein
MSGISHDVLSNILATVILAFRLFVMKRGGTYSQR